MTLFLDIRNTAAINVSNTIIEPAVQFRLTFQNCPLYVSHGTLRVRILRRLWHVVLLIYFAYVLYTE